MENYIKKSIILGLGVASLTKDKASQLIAELTKEGGMTEKEGEKIAKEIADKIALGRKKMEDEVNLLVKKIMVKMDIPSRKEIDEINKKLEKLNKKTDKK